MYSSPALTLQYCGNSENFTNPSSSPSSSSSPSTNFQKFQFNYTSQQQQVAPVPPVVSVDDNNVLFSLINSENLSLQSMLDQMGMPPMNTTSAPTTTTSNSITTPLFSSANMIHQHRSNPVPVMQDHKQQQPQQQQQFLMNRRADSPHSSWVDAAIEIFDLNDIQEASNGFVPSMKDNMHQQQPIIKTESEDFSIVPTQLPIPNYSRNSRLSVNSDDFDLSSISSVSSPHSVYNDPVSNDMNRLEFANTPSRFGTSPIPEIFVNHSRSPSTTSCARELLSDMNLISSMDNGISVSAPAAPSTTAGSTGFSGHEFNMDMYGSTSLPEFYGFPADNMMLPQAAIPPSVPTHRMSDGFVANNSHHHHQSHGYSSFDPFSVVVPNLSASSSMVSTSSHMPTHRTTRQQSQQLSLPDMSDRKLSTSSTLSTASVDSFATAYTPTPSPYDSQAAELDRNGRKPRVWRKRTYRCNHCDLVFPHKDLGAFAQHIHELEQQHGVDKICRKYKCPVDDCEWHFIGFTRKLEREKHFKRKHGRPDIQCGYWAGEGEEAFPGAKPCTTRWHTDCGNKRRHEIAIHGKPWTKECEIKAKKYREELARKQKLQKKN